MKLRGLVLSFAAWCLLAFWPQLVFGFQEPLNPPLPNFDKRLDGVAVPLDDAVRSQAVNKLKQRVKGLEVEFDRITGGPKWVRSRDEFLTGAKGQGRAVSAQVAQGFPENDPHRAVKAFLKEHSELFGHGPEAIEKARLKRDFETTHNGLHTAIWEQEYEGIPVFESILAAHTTSQGELASISSQFLPNLDAAANAGSAGWRALKDNPKVSAKGALARAAKNLGADLAEETVTRIEEDAPGRDARMHALKAPNIRGVSRTQLYWVPLSGKAMRLAWEVYLRRPGSGEAYRLLVDAETGEVIARHCRTFNLSDVTYRVFPAASPAPMTPGLPTPATNQAPFLERSLVTFSARSTNASPIGWIGDKDTETRGNNVDAHLDRDADDDPDLPRPQAAPGRIFDFPMDLNKEPSAYGDASAVQLFYWCNFMHDHLYGLGFTEAAGNYQKDNFGRGGVENDPVLADAQDGSGVNNAQFFPAPDGYSGRIEMFVFDGPTPRRDGSLDPDVVLHEYTHGMTDRMVGGGIGLYQLVTWGLAEGWSDFYALSVLAKAGDDVDGNYTEGGYVTYQLFGLLENYYFGIRRYPYTTDMTKNPLTFRDIDPAQANPYPSVPRNPIAPFNPSSANEPHRMGELWCVTLWEARANLIKKLGYETGNHLILQLVTDALKLSPPNPTFLQERDAILLADRVDTDGANQNELWAAFAKRGMGVHAAEGPNWTTEGTRESFDRPDALNITPALPILFSGPVGGPFGPGCRIIGITNTGAGSVAWAMSSGDPYLTLSASEGTLAAHAGATATICLTSAVNDLLLGSEFVPLFITNVASGVVQRENIEIRAAQFASMPFRENFDADQLAAYWKVSGEGIVSANLSTNLGPLSGPNHFLMQSGAPGYYARNELTLGIDLSGYTNVVLRLWAKEFRDQPEGPPPAPFFDGADFDGVAISADGYRWFEAGGLRRLREDYSEVVVDLDAALARSALAYSSSFWIRFNQTGNGVIPNNGIALDNISISGIAPRRLAVSVPEGVKESDGSVVGSVNLPLPVASDVTIQLTSSDPAVATVPASVVLRAGTTSAPFDISIIDDALLEDRQTTTIRATASQFIAGETVLQVADDEAATLTLELPSAVDEGSGPVSGAGIIRVSPTPGTDLLVQLTSNNPRKLQVSPGVVIRGGENSAQFDFFVPDDGDMDGPKSVTITAKLNDESTASASLIVRDNESTQLFVSLPNMLNESSTVIQSAGAVIISGILPTNITVSLFSSRPDIVRVPLAASIIAGRLSASFVLTLLDDNLVGAAREVTITAVLDGFMTGSNSVRILDNDSAPVPYNPNPAPFSLAGQSGVQLSWSYGTPELIANGGFESATLAGWHVENSGDGGFVADSGAINPPGPEGRTPAFDGQYSATLQQNSPGRHVIYQDIVVPFFFDSAVLNWTDRIRNHAGEFSEDHFFRVEIRTIDNMLLAVAYTTQPGQSAFGDWQERSFNLSGYRGSAIRIAFVEEDSLGFLNVHLDNIRVFLSSPGPVTSEVYFGTTPEPGPAQLLGVTTDPFFALPPLALDMSYYWRIIARRGASRAAGPVWQFTTRPAGSLDHFDWGSIAPAQTLGQPFSVTLTAKDNAGNTVSNFSRAAALGAFKKTPSETIQLVTFTAYAGPLEYRGTLAAISSYFTNYIESSFTATEAPVLEAQLAGKDVLLIPEQSSAPVGTLAAIGTSWGPVLSNFVSQGGVVVVCSQFGSEHEILSKGGLMQLTRVGSFGNATAEVSANHSLVLGVPASFPVPNVAGYTTDNGLGVLKVANTNVFIVLTRTFGAGQVVMIGYDFLANRSSLDRIVANGVGLADKAATIPVPLAPGQTSYFTDGAWSGTATLLGAGSNIFLLADDGAGHRGLSGPLTVTAPNDLALDISDAPDPVVIGSNVVYSLVITHTGPGTAQGVSLTALVPEGMSFVNATASQGACVLSNQTIVCTVGPMPPNTGANVTVELRANAAGRRQFSAQVESADPEVYVDNNVSAASTRVIYPSVFISDAVVGEGNSGTSSLVFSVQLRPALSIPASVRFVSTNLTATAGADYEAKSGLITFPPGTTNQTISFTVYGDTIYEGSELFYVYLFEPSNAIPGKVTGAGVILEDDPQPSLFIDDTSVVEGAAGSITQAVFTVRLSSIAEVPVSANFTAVSGTALPVLDYESVSGTVVIQPGAISTNIVVKVNGDALSETNETFSVKLSSPLNATLGRNQATGTILDDDFGLAGQFIWDPIGSPQSFGTPFPVRITARDALGNVASGFTGPVNLTGFTDSRIIGVPPDLEGTNTWNFPMGTYFHDQRVQSIYLASEVGEASRIIALSLYVSTIPGQVLNGWTIRVKHTPAARFDQALWEQGWTMVYQGREVIANAGWMTFYFSRAFEFNGVDNVLVDFSFNNDTYSTDGECASYSTSELRSLNFRTDSAYGDPLTWQGSDPPAALSRRVPTVRFLTEKSIPIAPPTSGPFVNGVWNGSVAVNYVAENISIRADDGNNHFGNANSFSVIATNDLAVTASDSPDPVRMGEIVTFVYTVTNTGPATSTGTVLTNRLPAGTAFMSATSSQGVCAQQNGSVNCTLGTVPSAATATVTVVAAALQVGFMTNEVTVGRIEPELFYGNNLARTVTRVNPPALSIADNSVTEGDAGFTNLILTVRLSSSSSNSLPVSVQYFTSDGTGTNNVDYLPRSGQLTFAPGVTNLQIAVPIVGDIIDEPNETFFLNLTNPSNAVLVQSRATGTIIDNDPVPIATVGDASVLEGNSGSTILAFPVRLSAPSGNIILFGYATSNGTATAGTDYVGLSSTFAVPPGLTNRTLNITVFGDSAIESDETFFVNFSRPQNTVLATNRVMGTILNDDGLPGVIDHFAWSAVPGTASVNQPFGMSIAAKDYFGNVVGDYSGSVILSGRIGQADVNVGTANSQLRYPFAAGSHDARTQVIYLGPELNGPRRIQGLALELLSPVLQPLNNWTIRMRHTSLSAYTSGAIWESNGWTTVYQGQAVITNAGWTSFLFSTPFQFDGTNNLMVDFSFNNSYFTFDTMSRFSATNQMRTMVGRADSNSGDPLAWAGVYPPYSFQNGAPDVRFICGFPVGVAPTTSDQFASGLWFGNITALLPATNLVLVADDAFGHLGVSDPFSVQFSGDSDGDGLPDAWEMQYFGSLHASNGAPNDDPDGDGLTNLQEYAAGTNPLQAGSVLAFVRTEARSGAAHIFFRSVTGKKYRLERSSTLVPSAWSTAIDNISGTGNIIELTDPFAAGAFTRFYRIRLLQ